MSRISINSIFIITSQIKQFRSRNNKYRVNGYPRQTIITDNSSRNLRCFKKNINTGNSLKDQIHQVEFCYENNKNSNIQTGELINRDEKSYIIKPLIFNDGEK